MVEKAKDALFLALVQDCLTRDTTPLRQPTSPVASTDRRIHEVNGGQTCQHLFNEYLRVRIHSCVMRPIDLARERT